ncbi:MAG: D-cysteine desulfhydrase family protein [Candidatus Thorarchaeota archaeon]
MFDVLPRERFTHLPTPLHRMDNLARSLGLRELWVKRDDMTGMGCGGNKSRKLEYIVGDARERGADTLVTVGTVQSNHCRQTAAAAALAGMRCVLLLSGEAPENPTGNILLDRLYGAEIVYCPRSDMGELQERMNNACTTLGELGLRPYAIPAGASVPLGVLAYVEAAAELKEQSDNRGFTPDVIVVAAGTGGTLAGIALGAELVGLETQVVGISVQDERSVLENRVRELIHRTQREYPDLVGAVEPSFAVDDQFLEEGYGVVTESVKSMIHMFARTEGLLIDPVYTGKAALGLSRMALSGETPTDAHVVFWHTGGEPALHAYAGELLG